MSNSANVRPEFFTNEILHSEESDSQWRALRARFLPLVHARQEHSTGQTRLDFTRVVEFLTNSQSHDSEGRDMGFNKQSFSRTELKTAASFPDDAIPNYLLYRYRFDQYPRHRQVAEFPIIIAIEPTSVCNIRCTMCFQSDNAFGKNREFMGFMDWDLYTKVIDEGAENGLGGVVLASRGEPLLHPDIGRMVSYAKRNGVLDVKLNTNATRLNDTICRDLLRAGLDTLVFSVDSADKDRFEAIRVGASFDRVCNNIARFHAIRASEFPNSQTRTRISMILLNPDDEDLAQTKEFWSERVDEFACKGVHDLLGIYNLPTTNGRNSCSFLWERLYVWWDGLVNTCSEDYMSSLAIGTAYRDGTIKELWHGQQMSQYRILHESGHKCELNVCSRCSGY